MATSSATWTILAASATTASSTIILVDAGTAGDPGTLRSLTHPDSANFPVVTYACNPSRTLNFDQDVLFPPTSRILRTLDTTQVFVTENSESDVIVTEVWEGNARRTKIIASFFRRMYELSINPPEVATPEQFLIWAPADRTTDTYNVILSGIRLGGIRLDFKEWGLFAAGDLDTVPTGLLDRTLEVDLKIVSKIVV